MISEAQYECSKSSFFRLPVILGICHVQSSYPTDLNSHGSQPAVQTPISIPTQTENADHNQALPSYLGSLSISQLLLLSSLSPLLYHVLSSPIPFLCQLHCFCHISWAQKVREWVGLNLFLVTSSVTPDTRDSTSHSPSVPALPQDGVKYEPYRMKDSLQYKELRSQTNLQCATVYRYFKSISSPNLAIKIKQKSTTAQPQRQLSTTSFTSFCQCTEAPRPQTSCKCWSNGPNGLPEASQAHSQFQPQTCAFREKMVGTTVIF